MAIVRDLSGNAPYPKQVAEKHIPHKNQVKFRPIGDSQQITSISGAVDASFTVFDNRASDVRIHPEEAIHWAWNRAATQTDPVLPADTVEYFPFDEGDILHVTAESTGGSVQAQGVK